MAKADRLLSLLWLLRSRGKLTASQIAGELGINQRTVYRYIDALCESGAPIASEGGPGGGYLLLETFREPPVFFDDEERTALLHASAFAGEAGYPLSAALGRALAKIRRRMSAAQLSDLARHAAALDAVPATVEADAAPSEVLRRLEAAAAEGRLVTIQYASVGAGERTRRAVEPYGIVYWSGSWYLVGYCRLREAMRLFRVDRIRSLEENPERFARPEGFSAREWFARALMPPAPDAATSIVVRIEGEAGAIDHLARQWFLKPFVRNRERCTLELTLDAAAAADHLPGLLLGYGTSLRIASPRELSLRLAELAARISTFHANNPKMTDRF